MRKNFYLGKAVGMKNVHLFIKASRSSASICGRYFLEIDGETAFNFSIKELESDGKRFCPKCVQEAKFSTGIIGGDA